MSSVARARWIGFQTILLREFGRILRITETEVALREVVQDAAGEWTERTATLQLQERAQEKAR